MTMALLRQHACRLCTTGRHMSRYGTHAEPFIWNADAHWKDPLQLQSQLDKYEVMAMNSARALVRTSLADKIQTHFRTEAGPTRGIIKDMGSAGLLGCQLPEQWGGAGASFTSYGLLAREMERCDSAYRSALSVQSSLVILPIHRFGSPSLKDRILPALVSGELVGCCGLTEPNHGSDPTGMQTVYTPLECGGYVLSGTKTWITHAPIADVFVIWAKGPDGDSPVRGFVLERGANGLYTNHIQGKFSLRASPTGMITMEDVYVARESVLNVTGMKGPFSCLNSARLGITWGVLGAAEECLTITRRYLLDRCAFGRPLAANQLIQKRLTNAYVQIAMGSQLALRLSRLYEYGALHSNMISMGKYQNCRAALTISRDCRDMLGANGIVDEYGVIRHVLNLEAVSTYEGTSDIHALILGRAITGIPAF